LDEIPTSSKPDPAADWFSDMQHSLESSPQDWTSAIARIGSISDEHAWSLLAWAELESSQVVRTQSPNDLATAAFALALALQSELDRRDCAIVCSLLRRASVLAALDFTSCVADGCDRAGDRGREAFDLLLSAPAKTPSTHSESGVGQTFLFNREPPGFDVDELERWLEDEDH
jgi:hypothetical protein